MHKKTIWYCHHYAGSPSLGMSYRPYYLTREFNKKTHNAYVISANEHHLLQKKCPQTKAVELKEIDGVPFVQLKTRPYRGNGLGRIFNMLQYALRFRFNFKKIINITGKPDVIIVSCSHLFHYPVLERIAKKYQAKLFFEVRDLWPQSLIDLLKISPYNPLVLWLARIERKAYRNANGVVSLLDAALPYMQKKGLDEKRFFVIPNGASIELFQSYNVLSKHINDRILELKAKGQFLLGYAGALGSPNAMEYLVSAMKYIAQQKLPIHCIIVGEGSHKLQLEHEANRLDLDNITFFPAISKYEIPPFLHSMDALYLGWSDEEIYQYGVSPNKMFDYMMSGKPIIESGGKVNGLIHQFSCGIQCDASQPMIIAEAIINMYKTSVEDRAAMGLRGKNAVEKFYEYGILAQKYHELF